MDFQFKLSQLLKLVLAITLLLTAGCNRERRAEVKKQVVGDIEIAYYMRGSGAPLVMIMGFRGTMGVWDPALLEALEKHFTLILFDNRGIGMTTDTEADNTTIQQMADDTAGLIAALGYKKANILGWSMGARIAMQLAVSHADIIDHVILCSPNPGKQEVPRETGAYAKLTSKSLSQDNILPLIFPDTIEGKKAQGEYVARLTKAVIEGSVPKDLNVTTGVIVRQAHALKQWVETNSVYEALPGMKLPVLATGGLMDVLDSPANVQLVVNRIPFAWAAYFSGAGHAFLFQDAQRFADLVVLFTQSTTVPPL